MGKLNSLSVVVTGGTGQIAYSFLFLLASGEVFGESTRIDLTIYDIPGKEVALSGLIMELEDGVYPFLSSITYSTKLEIAFKDIDVAFLIGAKPRTDGMERGDLLKENGKIFSEQGKVLNMVAKPTAKVFVVGNPANTNCLLAMKNAPNLNKRNFHAMTRLDQNRMHFMLAKKAGVALSDVKRLVIWGNHSVKQVPDFTQALIGNYPANSVIDNSWLETVLVPNVQNRGSSVIKARGLSSAASAARALACSAASIFCPNLGEVFSSGICSDNNPYGIEESLIFSFPCRYTDKLPEKYEIVSGLFWNDFIKRNIKNSEQELIEERNLAEGL